MMPCVTAWHRRRDVFAKVKWASFTESHCQQGGAKVARRIQPDLLDALKKIDRPGTFCTSGCLPSALPGLEVAGLGAVALPLGKREAAALKKRARQAPYGKGMQTLVDTKVRRVWEIDAEQVVLGNPQWPDIVEQAVRAAQSALGLEKQKLQAHLYKLLLYEPGSFFLSHRDGEKLDRMVATLVVVFPSAHEGGELIVRHEGQEVIVDFGPQSRFETQFAAFYADCEHEIRPVTSGYRLALVYNLTLEKSKRNITAPTSREHIAAATRLLRQWSSQARDSSEDAAPSKLAVLLDHQYTPAGLTRDALKGVDRAKADVLFAAAREAGCDASLALVTLWQSGSAEPSGDYGYGYGSGRRRGYGRYESDSDDGSEDENGGEHEMGEVFDSSLTAEHFSDADGNPLAFGEIPLDEEEIVTKQQLAEGKPDKEDFEGYTGNAGMTLERWYHRAAIVLWPTEHRFDVLCEAGEETAVGGLAQMVKRWKQAKQSEQGALQQPCVEFAKRIIANWPERKFAYHYRSRDDKKGQASLLSLLEMLADPALVSAYIEGVLAKDASADPGRDLGDICRRLGWLSFQDQFRSLMANTSNETLQRHAWLLADFALRKDKDADRKALCAELAEEMMSAVERWDPHGSRGTWETATVDLAKLLPPLVQSFLVLDEPALLDRLVAYVLERPQAFDLTTVQVPVLLDLAPWLTRNVKRPSAPLSRWLAAVLEALQARAADPPREPADWRRDSATNCKCADCRELSRFLQDPDQETLRLPLVQHRRQHLHQIIDGRRLDTTHVTERRGRPYTLVCTKTKASYQRALKAHHVDLDHLARVCGLIESLKMPSWQEP
jgi:hypothetical protein